MGLTKKDIIDITSKKLRRSQKEVSEILETVLEVIQERLAQDQPVTLVGFGRFEVRKRAARKGRNPITGEVLQIPKTKTPAFAPGASLVSAVKGH